MPPLNLIARGTSRRHILRIRTGSERHLVNRVSIVEKEAGSWSYEGVKAGDFLDYTDREGDPEGEHNPYSRGDGLSIVRSEFDGDDWRSRQHPHAMAYWARGTATGVYFGRWYAEAVWNVHYLSQDSWVISQGATIDRFSFDVFDYISAAGAGAARVAFTQSDDEDCPVDTLDEIEALPYVEVSGNGTYSYDFEAGTAARRYLHTIEYIARLAPPTEPGEMARFGTSQIKAYYSLEL